VDKAKTTVDTTGWRRCVVFGGSFDPPHIGHTRLPEMVRQAIGADRVLYIPCGRQPMKLGVKQAGGHHRLAMLKLALAGVANAEVLTDELERAAKEPGPTYTVDTLEELKERMGDGVEFRLLIGGDQLRQFDRWREPERIIELAKPVVMVRLPDTRESLLRSLPVGYSKQEWEGRLIDVPQLDVGSTQVRGLVRQGGSIQGMVLPAVAEYIREHGLYRGA